MRLPQFLFRSLPEFRPEKGEKVLWTGRPSLRAFWILYVCGSLSVILSLLVPVLLPFSLLFLLAVCLLAPALRNATLYIVTDRRVRQEFRFWVGRVKEARLGMQTNTAIRQDAVQRVLGIADIVVFTPYVFGGVRLWGLQDYEKVEKLISRS